MKTMEVTIVIATIREYNTFLRETNANRELYRRVTSPEQCHGLIARDVLQLSTYDRDLLEYCKTRIRP